MVDDHDWLTLHRVRFSAVKDGAGKPLPGPGNAKFWRFAPASEMGADGMWTNQSAIWGGFALHSSKSAAEAVFDDPQAHLPFLDQAVEQWHALVIPYAHRGAVQWGDAVQDNSAIRVARADPKGPLVVLTTAGYTNPGPVDESRTKAFLSGIVGVIDFYGTLSGNVRRAVFPGGGVDGREGCTISLWKDDAAMMSGAYKTGEHKAQMDLHRKSALFDRSSFSRGRILASKGSWDGGDPVAEMTG